MSTLKSVIDLMEDLRQENVYLSVDNGELVAKGDISKKIAQKIRTHKAEIISVLSAMDSVDSRSADMIVPDKINSYAPFPLNETQQAYWLGRDAVFESGEVAIHVFIEMDDLKLDLERAEAAWRKVYAHHEMLRAVVLPNGTQQILETPPAWSLPVEDLRECDADECLQRITALRDEMSYYCADLNLWPSWKLIGFKLPENRQILMLSLDCWAIDGRSIQILASDFETLYRDPGVSLPETELTFRDYVLGLEEEQKTAGYQKSLAYWQARVKELPEAPKLPSFKKAAEKNPRFVRHARTLPVAVHKKLKKEAATRGLTLANVLIACYAQVLGRWSGSEHFTLNIPRWNRHSLHQDVDQIVGEFATFELLEVNLDWANEFEKFAIRLQQQFAEDLNHDIVSGVRILREWRKNNGADPGVAMPFVFTHEPDLFSNEGRSRAYMASFNQIATVTNALTQTPQVWIDAQYHDVEGNLFLVWDALDDLFPANLIDDMFDAYVELVEQLGTITESWNQQGSVLNLPQNQKDLRKKINATDKVFDLPLFRNALAQNAQKSPDVLAVSDHVETVNWAELKRRVDSLSGLLFQQGIGYQTRVGVIMEKGVEQIVAALALHQIGAICVPLDPDAPVDRLCYMVEHCKTQTVLTQAHLENQLKILKTNLSISLITIERDYKTFTKTAFIQPQLTPEDLHCILYTSGSTGQPKGVMVQLGSLMNVVADGEERFGENTENSWLSLTPFHHDLSLFDLFSAVSFGGQIILPDPAKRRDPEHWVDLIEQHGIGGWNSVPAMMTMLLDHCEGLGQRQETLFKKLSSLQSIILGGDWVPLETPTRLMNLMPQAQLTTIGGPTETTIWNITYKASVVPEGWSSIPYGTPSSNNRYYVLNPRLEDCPDWVPGELCCAGLGVTAGYLADKTRTEQAYIMHPRTGERLYKTGDRGRFHPNGLIEFIGRDDHQINLNGYRMELGEVETALARHPSVNQAVVVPLKEGNVVRNTVAWVQLLSDMKADQDTLMEFLKQKLPAQMQPKSIQILDQFPLTPNGKLDRKRLEADISVIEEASVAFIPENQTQEDIANVWLDVIGTYPPSIDTSFFDLGGDSITAIRLFNKLFSGKVEGATVLSIFRAPTIKAQAELLDKAGDLNGSDLPPVLRTERDDISYPATHAQTRLWFEERLTENSSLYNLSFNLELKGQVDAAVIEHALDRIIEKWENFRIALREGEEGDPVQILLPYWQLDLQQSDLTGIDTPDLTLKSIGHSEADKPFDLASGRLLRAHLVRLSSDRSILIVTMHHAVSDGTTFNLFVKSLTDYLKGHNINAPLLSSIDYGRWEQLPEVKSEVEKQAIWWQNQLEGDVPGAELSIAKKRPAVRSATGSLKSHMLTSDLSNKIYALAQRNKSTPYVTLMTGVALVLRYWNSNETIRIGSHVGLRTQPELEEIPGMLVNNIVLDLDYGDVKDFESAIAITHTCFMDGWDHALVPFNRLVQAKGGWPDTSRHPLYNITFTHESMQADVIDAGPVSLTFGTPFVAQAPLDLDLAMAELPDNQIILKAVYNNLILNENDLVCFFEALETLLETVYGRSNFPLGKIPKTRLSEIDLLNLGAGPLSVIEDGVRPISLFDTQVFERPNAPALLNADGTLALSYEDLDQRVNQAAIDYREKGVKVGDTVCIQLSHGPDLVAAMLAVWRVGGHFVALSTNQPEVRRADIIEGSNAALLVSKDETDEWGIAVSNPEVWQVNTPDDHFDWGHSTDELAALVYTSGSTGIPNGVEFTVKALVNRLNWQWDNYPFDAEEACVARTSVDFVDYLAEIFAPLLAGHSLALIDDSMGKDPLTLANTVHAVNAQRLLVVPSLLDLLLDEAGEGVWISKLSRIKTWVSSGESIKRSTLTRLFETFPNARLLNLYGSSETGADVTVEDITVGQPTVGGKPISNMGVYVVDKDFELLPPGIPGQLLVAGYGLARGYRDQPELTDKRFITWQNRKAFLTGDWGLKDKDGCLTLLGRLDRQVKIRGQRVDLGEVENALAYLPEIKETAATISEDGEIIAAIVGDKIKGIRGRLKRYLTDAALPKIIVNLAEIPRTSGGKIAYTQLSQQIIESYMNQADYQQDDLPKTATEQHLDKLWYEVLSQSSRSRSDRFHELGGHSIAVARLAARIRRDFAIELPLRSIIEHNTLSEMASAVEHLQNENTGSVLGEESEVFTF